MTILGGRSRKLEAAANALLRNDTDPLRMARARSGKNLAIGDREYQKRRKIEKIKAARFEAQETFRHLPKPIRRALTERFKTERAAGSTVDWNDWLKRQLEIIHGLSVQ